MKTEDFLMDVIKKKLENDGTVFGEYYGSLIHSSGPKPSEFFKPVNEGNYTVYVFTIPDRFFIKTINTEVLAQFLK